MKTRIRTVMTAVWAAVCAQMIAAAEPPVETPAQKAERMRWFTEARFGLFIHFGLYAIPGGEWKGRGGHGEWIRTSAKIPLEEYDRLAEQFNPVKFNADEWARTAKDAGMGYIVITSKHHDGFALWDSAVSEFDVMSTPFKRDILKELSEACRRNGLMFCTYHSILDWHHPDYLPRRSWEKNRSAEGADPERYLAYMKAQLKEIITRYGPIGILWFDGEWEPFWTHERGLDLDRYVRSLQPSIIINNRIDKGRDGMKGMTRGDGYAGDYGTPEQEVPAAGFGDGIYWESCMTMQRAWGYTRDREVRPSRELIRHLSDIACKGGNFLLNVGPQPDGQFPAECIERLRAVGAWMKTNAEAIRGTSAGPVRRMDQRATVRGNRLYVHIHDWPSSKRVEMPGLMNRVLGARALAAPGLALKIQGGPGAWAVELPETAPDPDVTVVAVDLDGPPRVDNAIRPGIDGSVHLRPAEATIQGSKLRVESRSSNLGYWTDDADFASWDFALEKGGVFTVQVEAACPAESAGGRYAVNIVDQSVGGEIPDTGGWGCYRVLEPGRVTIPQGGSYSLALRGRKAPGAVAVMNVKGVRLVPAP